MADLKMNVVNMTPHPINVRITENDTEIELVFPPSGKIVRLKEVDVPCLNANGEPLTVNNVPVVIRRFELSELPEEFNDYENCIIVSLPVLQALAMLEKRPNAIVVAPDTGSGAIRDESGRIIAVRRFITMW